jgi:hypothetical protein
MPINESLYDGRLAHRHVAQEHDFVFDIAHACAFQIVYHFLLLCNARPATPFYFIVKFMVYIIINMPAQQNMESNLKCCPSSLDDTNVTQIIDC